MSNALHAMRRLASGAMPSDRAGDSRPAPVRRSLRLLVAEDNPVNQRVIKRVLDHAGHSVRIAGSGEEALDALEEGRFDAFLVDVNMPGISGLDVVKLFRIASLDQPRLPIVALSADATPETRKAAEEAGVDAYLTKPVEPRRLLETLDLLQVPESAPSSAARAVADPPPPQRIAQISEHPRYRAESSPAINWSILDNLARFADSDFVIETLNEYVTNAESLIAAMEAAVQASDTRAFRDNVHALRGTSGNVGAEAVSKLCQDLHGIGRERLRSSGHDEVQQIRRELARFRRELTNGAATLRRSTSA